MSRLQAPLIFVSDDTFTAGFQACHPVQLTMSREPVSQGCQQLTRILRQHEEQLAPAVPLHLLWLQLKAWPAARRNIQIPPHIPEYSAAMQYMPESQPIRCRQG